MRIIQRQTQRARRGAAAVELAVLLPILCFLFVIAIDYARIFYFSLTLENAARNGAYFASNYPGIYSYQTAEQVVLSDARNISPVPPEVAVRYSSNKDGPYTATAPIANGYVEVKVTWMFTSVTNFPGMPSQTQVVRAVRMQVAPITPTFN